MKQIIAVIAILFLTVLNSFAQENGVEMVTGMRSSGKIYVVVTVVCVIFTGLVTYLFSIDRRLKKLEARYFHQFLRIY